jgi:L-lactate dehydrogenase
MKIGIIGAGMVGSTAAYAMIMRGVGREIVLVDLNKKRAQAEADDLLHAVPFANPLEIRSGGYSDLHDSQIVIIAAGMGQRPGETRLQLLDRNARVFKDIIPQVLKDAPETILLVATNPVDVMTHLAARYAAEMGLPYNKIMGSGTTLDTARFRALLGRRLGVDSQHVHAYVIGEHGDSEVLTWSLVTVAGIPLDEFCRIRNIDVCDEDREEIDDKVRHAAYHLIEAKGATYYGVGSALARIVETILRDRRSILTVCTPVENIAGINDVTLSLPHLVGGQGVLATYHPPLNPEEGKALQSSAQLLRRAISSLERESNA